MSMTPTQLVEQVMVLLNRGSVMEFQLAQALELALNTYERLYSSSHGGQRSPKAVICINSPLMSFDPDDIAAQIQKQHEELHDLPIYENKDTGARVVLYENAYLEPTCTPVVILCDAELDESPFVVVYKEVFEASYTKVNTIQP